VTREKEESGKRESSAFQRVSQRECGSGEIAPDRKWWSARYIHWDLFKRGGGPKKKRQEKPKKWDISWSPLQSGVGQTKEKTGGGGGLSGRTQPAPTGVSIISRVKREWGPAGIYPVTKGGGKGGKDRTQHQVRESTAHKGGEGGKEKGIISWCLCKGCNTPEGGNRATREDQTVQNEDLSSITSC